MTPLVIGEGATPEGKHLTAYLKPVHRHVVGAAADTNIAVAGIEVGDELLSVVDKANGGADFTADASVTSAGNIQITVATGTLNLHVIYADLT